MRYVLVLLLLILVDLPTAAAPGHLEFDGETYQKARSATEGGVDLIEYLREGETESSWDQMISLQIHPHASRIADVMNPYAAARKPLLVRDVAIYRSSSGDHAEDSIFEFLLGAPDGSHMEFALVRAVADPNRPVTLFIFSKRIPVSNTVSAEEILSKALDKRADWLRSLTALLTPTSPNRSGH
jgi:hypothetical protein